ncbi:MAG TPA: ABC transporter permease [Chloroflexota bacterium]|nr:ABC transporter permease [Chloroflexota bacterium]
MRRHLLTRLFLFVPSLVLASIAIFGAMHVLPGDVALVILGNADPGSSSNLQLLESYREALGLHDPLPVQYGRWIWSLVNGEFGGTSIIDHEPLRDIIARRFPATLELALIAFVTAWVVSVPLGVVAALRRDTWLDYVVRGVTIAGHAVPIFWAALLVLLGLTAVFHWTPPVVYSSFAANPAANLQKVIWPALLLAWGFSSYLARVTRSSMLEVLAQDYVRTARSKGLSVRAVSLTHCLRNALIPVVTVGALQIGTLLSGSIILETIFGVPGVGQGIISAAISRDYPVIQSLAMFLVLLMLILNLGVDLLYGVIDPRLAQQ